MRKSAFLLLSLLLAAPLAMARDGASKGAVPAQPQPAPGVANGPACGERIKQVSNFLVSGSSKSAAFLFLPESETEQRLSSISLSVENRDAPESYASASFSPSANRACGAAYDSVTYWPQTCDTLASGIYANLKAGGKLGQHILILAAANNSRVFLMPAGSGCVAIKKELIY